MARKINDSIDLAYNELQNVSLQTLAADPGAGLVDGRIWYDTVLDAVRVQANGTIVSLASGMDAEAVQDIVGAMVASNTETGITVTYTDQGVGLGILDFAVTDSPLLNGQNAAWYRDRTNHTGSQTASTISDFTAAATEVAQDVTGTIVGLGGIVVTYDDAGTGLTTLTLTNNEALQDAIGPFFASGTGSSGITVAYDDAGGDVNYTVTNSPLLENQNSAYHLSRTNHTNTQLFSTVTTTNTDKLLGRDTAAGGPVEEISLSSDLEFTGTSAIRVAAYSGGDITKTAGANSATIAANAVTTAKILDANVTDAKLANQAATSLKGNPTGAPAAPSAVTLASDHEFSGTTIRLAAYSGGDITKAAGANSATITANAVTTAKILDANVTNAKLAGMSASTIKGQIVAGSGAPVDMTSTQAKAVLNIVPADVTGFDTQVRTSTLNQMGAATADVSHGGFKITNLAPPLTGTDAANKNYVDGVATGLDFKASVKIASTATIAGTYAATGGTSGRGQFTAMSNANIDGIALVVNDRLLLKDQSTGAQNGVWVVTTVGTGANGVWDRAGDFDSDAEVTPGAFVFVEQGTVNADSGWVVSNDGPIVLGGASSPTALTFVQFSGAGQVVAGTGLTKTGNSLDVIGGTGIAVTADAVAVDRTTGAGRVPLMYAVALTGGATSEVITHSLGTRDVVTMFYLSGGTFAEEEFSVEHTSTTTITVRSAITIPAATYRVVVLG